MQTDFYSVLGVPKDATPGVIKAAYRRLARRWHPDLNSDGRAAAEFSRISEAYAVLGDRDRRASWDKGAWSRPPQQNTVQTRPIRCSECGDVTAQPRILVFRSSIGLGVWSYIRKIEGLFCSRCARRSGLRASLVTAFAGWWAIPVGPLVALWCMGRNAAGGLRYPIAERRLALMNAQAFLEQNNINLAYALAKRALDGAKDAEEIKAREIIAQAQSQGGDSYALLKNPWRPKLSYLSLHALLMAGPPAVLIAAAVALVWK